MKFQIVKDITNLTDFCDYLKRNYDLIFLDYEAHSMICNFEISNEISEEDVVNKINEYVPSDNNYIYSPQIFPITRVKNIGNGLYSSVFSWSFTGTNVDSTCGIQLKLDSPCNIKLVDVTNASVIATKDFLSSTSEAVNVLYDKEKLPQKPAIFELSIACTNSSPQTIISLFSFISPI